MGVLSGKDLLSAKYITAIISDSDDQVFFIPIKYPLGDWFTVEFGEKIFAFTLKNVRMLTHRDKRGLTRSFRIVEYDTSNTKSLRPETKGLEILLEKNHLPKMNMMLYGILAMVGRKEKNEKEFTPHNLVEFMESLSGREEQYPEEVRNITNFLDSLDITEIVTPTKKITDFIFEDLIAEDAGFLGEMVPRFQRLDNEHKITSNKPIGSKIAWMKWILILVIIVAVVLFVYHGYTQGWFKTFTDLGGAFKDVHIPSAFSPITPAGQVVHDDAYYQANYTPETLKAAIDRGEIDINTLPPATKELVKNVQLPTVSP